MINLKTSLAQLNELNKGTLMGHLGIEYLEVGEGFVHARMPVDERTMQPAGILHGGSSLALAETIGGLGSLLLVDNTLVDVRGSHISANHIRTAIGKWVFGKAQLIHMGKNTHLWNIDILDENNQIISCCRLTNFLVPKNNGKDLNS
ncbi:MAG TPA: hotdog fold thioesterase [Bacteroidales bacterium]|nr:hotdog fold thioesterase [Bacteroidales bacterium]